MEWIPVVVYLMGAMIELLRDRAAHIWWSGFWSGFASGAGLAAIVGLGLFLLLHRRTEKNESK